MRAGFFLLCDAPLFSFGSEFAGLDVDLDKREAEGNDQGPHDNPYQSEGLNTSQDSEKKQERMDIRPRADDVW
jgi:hypothetical protein